MSKLGWILFVATLALVGCASPTLSPDQRHAIKRIGIAEVSMPGRAMVLSDKAGAAFLLGGPIGIAVANSSSDLPTEYARLLDRNGIDVAALVRADLQAQLTRQGFEVVAQGQPSDAVLVTKVLQYGLTGYPFAAEPVRVPALWLRVELKRPGSDDTLWWHWASVHVTPGILDQLEQRPVRDYFDDASMLERQVRKASRLVTEAALSKM